MKKIIAFGLIVAAAFFSTRSNSPCRDNQNTSEPQSKREFELAKTEDGRFDVSVLLASKRLPDERKRVVLDADDDEDGFITQEELNLAILRASNGQNVRVADEGNDDENNSLLQDGQDIAFATQNDNVPAFDEFEYEFHRDFKDIARPPLHRKMKSRPPFPEGSHRRPPSRR